MRRLFLGLLAAFLVDITFQAALPVPVALAEALGVRGPGESGPREGNVVQAQDRPGASVSDDFALPEYRDPGVAAPVEQPLWQAALWFLIKLGFVIGLIYGTLFFYKRLLGTRAPLALGRVRVLETTRLAGTQSLFLVQAGEQIMLIGSNGAGLMVKLSEWPADAPPPIQSGMEFTRKVAQAEGRADDFQGIMESSIRQAVIPPEAPRA